MKTEVRFKQIILSSAAISNNEGKYKSYPAEETGPARLPEWQNMDRANRIEAYDVRRTTHDDKELRRDVARSPRRSFLYQQSSELLLVWR